VNPNLEPVVVSELETLGYDLVELQQRGTKNRPVIEVRIDRRDGEQVTVEDCTRASRALEARLDGGELVSDRYVLEVSSPGVERPLRHAREWRRFVGKRASVNSPALNGRAEYEIVEIEGEDGAEVAVLKDARGNEHRVSLAEVKDARLAFHWKR
jgi:ribosome maturation factor RimP